MWMVLQLADSAFPTGGFAHSAGLEAAAQAGEIVRVVYYRGSQPGTVRKIVPIALIGDDVRANHLAAGIDTALIEWSVPPSGGASCRPPIHSRRSGCALNVSTPAQLRPPSSDTMRCWRRTWRMVATTWPTSMPCTSW